MAQHLTVSHAIALQEKVSNYEKERSYLFYRQNMLLHPSPDPFLTGHSFLTLLVNVQREKLVGNCQPVPENTVVGTPVNHEESTNGGCLNAFLHPPAA